MADSIHEVDTSAMREEHLIIERRARYFAMGGDGGQAQSVWMLCHGYGQLARSFLEQFAPYARGNRLLLAPEGLSRFYLGSIPHGPRTMIGASWMTREDRLSEISDYVHYLDRLHMHATHGTHERVETLGLGFSQGVATVARWIALGRTHVDRAILWAGSIPPEADLAAAQREGRLGRLDVVYGTQDKLVRPAAFPDELARLVGTGLKMKIHTFDGGHTIDPSVLAKILGSSI